MKNKPIKVMWPKKANLETWGQLRKEIEGVGNPDIVRIGASDISVCTGTNTYKCPARLYHHLTGYHSSFFITETTAAGHALEPIIADRFASYIPDDEMTSLINFQNGFHVRKVKKANFFVLNEAYPHMSASLDYVFVGKQYSPWTGALYQPLTPIENKSTNKGYFMHWKDGITPSYYEQVQSQLLLTNTEVAVFNVLVDGVKYHVREVEADREVQEFIVHKVNEFVERVKVGKAAYQYMQEAKSESEYEEFKAIYDSAEPDPVAMDDNLDLENELHETSELIKKATEEDEILMSQYIEASDKIKKMEEAKTLCRIQLVKNSNGFEGIEGDNYKMLNRSATKFKKGYFAIKAK